MATLYEEPLTNEQSLQFVHDHISEWNNLLEKIDSSVRQWRQYLDTHRDNEAHDSAPKHSRTRSDSMQSINEDSPHFSKRIQFEIEVKQPFAQRIPARRVRDDKQLVLFDATSQGLLDELVRKLQGARNRLIRTISASDPPAASRSVQIRSNGSKGSSPRTPRSQPTAVPGRECSDPLIKTVKRLDHLITQSQHELEEAAYQLLRKGTCSTQNVNRLFSECAELARPRDARLASPLSSSLRSGSSPSRSIGQRSDVPEVLEVDDADEDSDGEGEALDARLDAIRLRSKQMASRIHGPAA